MRSGRAAGVVGFRPHRAVDGCIHLHAAHAEHTMAVATVWTQGDLHTELPRLLQGRAGTGASYQKQELAGRHLQKQQAGSRRAGDAYESMLLHGLLGDCAGRWRCELHVSGGRKDGGDGAMLDGRRRRRRRGREVATPLVELVTKSRV